MILDSSIINHPVHIKTKDYKISPSAFIPFCDFGGSMSAMGVKIDQFDVPVCNSFQAKTSWPYFGVKLSRVFLMFSYRKKSKEINYVCL